MSDNEDLKRRLRSWTDRDGETIPMAREIIACIEKLENSKDVGVILNRLGEAEAENMALKEDRTFGVCYYNLGCMSKEKGDKYIASLFESLKDWRPDVKWLLIPTRDGETRLEILKK